MNPNSLEARLMAFDAGAVRIGVARSTALGTAEPTATIQAKGRAWRDVAREIGELIRLYNPARLVVGWPKNMDGSVGAQARQCEQFANALRNSFPGIEVALEDERMTTEGAYERLADAGKRGRKARARIDAAAACMIVEAHLARLEHERRLAERAGGRASPLTEPPGAS